MQSGNIQIRELLARVRARWRRLIVYHAAVRAAIAVAGVLAVGLTVAALTGRSPFALATVGVVALVLSGVALAWGLWPAREVPSDSRVARFIEEHEPTLDDRLVSAVDLKESAERPILAEALVADAGRRASEVDPAVVVPGDRLRRAGLRAAAAALLVAVVAFFGRDTARQSFDALSFTLFPERMALDVRPGSTRVPAGSPLTIEARLVGNRAPVVAQVLRADAAEAADDGGDGNAWRADEMAVDPSGAFTFAIESVSGSFKYRVAAGTVKSETYEVRVARPPRVARIDLDYTYPASLRMAPRTEEDGGDVYAPAGTEVRVRVHTDGGAATGHLTLANGRPITLAAEPDGRLLSGTITVGGDNSYRVALADADGLSNPGDTEYFIRTLEDRPPDVHVVKPARDRSVTRLEEVDIEVEAEDDYGIERLDLVYAVRGGRERTVPLRTPRGETAVSSSHTLYLEDLDVQPGDFVSYYVRARDVARGKAPSETRSDIFFLEVKPFDQEFALAQSQASGAGGGGSNRSIDDLVAAQKEIIVATWKLDRRSQASGSKSESDIKAVGRAEAELKTRVEETSSSFRESTMRDPRRGQPQPGRGGQPPRPPGGDPPLRAGQTLPEEDAMTAAATAMGKAVGSLDRLKTGEALPPEMEALNHLLRAQADVKRREVMRQQQAGGGGGQNRASQDLSSLFDKELQKQQQTNYETPTTTEQRESSSDSMLDKIKELARRQDELMRREQDLARQRDRMSAEELKRELEKLTREQLELRERAENMARQLERSQQQQGSSQQQRPGQQQQGAGQQSQSAGQQSQGAQGQSQSAQGQSQGAQGQSQGAGNSGQQMRDASEAMRNAANELRRQDPSQASASGNRALKALEDLQRQMQAEAPDERRRALGDMQLEARQLADAQRQVAAERGKAPGGEAGADTLRRLAGEQERLADRVRRMQNSLQQQAGGAPNARGERGRGGQQSAEAARNAAREATREIERQRLVDRMEQSADEMRNGTQGGRQNGEAGRAGQAGQAGQVGQTGQAGQAGRDAREQQEIARALDRLADTLAAATAPTDAESRRLTDQLARAQEARDRIESLTREMEQLAQQNSPGSRGGQSRGGNATGQSGEVARLREEYARQLQQTRELLDQLRRENPQIERGGAGLTFEAQGMVLSAPGTEAFKQDFAKWEQLRKQATLALERAEQEISRKLQAKQARDRMAAGVDDRAPAGYQQRVDNYFKALAEKKKP
jgi:uncharacterized protein DUF4175